MEKMGDAARDAAGRSMSSISSDCSHHVFNYVTTNFLVPGVQHIATLEAKSIVYVDFVDGTLLPVFDHGKYYPGTDGLAFTLCSARCLYPRE